MEAQVEPTDPREELLRLRSELEASTRVLVESYRMASLGRLVTGIAHEISTPVGSILSNNGVVLRSLELLRKLLSESSTDSAPQLAKAREIIETLGSLAAVDKLACERIASVVPGLKTFARAEETELRKADLNQILRNTLALAQAEFRSRIWVETDLGALPEVECYPQSLHQVFLNLLTNAGQAVEGQGRVTVRTRLGGDQVRVSIRDTGSGIKAEHRSKIFSPGFTTKPMGLGAGLGLSIARQIVVDRHGGSIDFETESGVGSTFHVRIPVAQASKAPG
jgi:signal transduction histidine kinase